MSRATWGTVAAIVPDDDAIWRLRGQSQQAISLRLGISRYALRDVVRPRGWRWKPGGGGASHAPCRSCSTATPVDDLSYARECRGCAPVERPVAKGLTPNQRLARDERRKRRDRIGTPEWEAEYRRIGGPEWGGRRRAAA